MTDTTRIDRDALIVAAIATGSSQEEAATLVGCSRRTVVRRLADPQVQANLQEERTRLGAEIADLLTGSLRAVVIRLRAISSTGSDRDAINAGRVLIGEGRAWRDHAWTDARLDAIEDQLRDQQDRPA